MTDYVTDAQGRLTSQFSEEPRIHGFVGALVGGLADVDAVCDTLATGRWISTAEGVQLDGCGAIVGEIRAGRTDAAYRDAIRFRVFANTSQGTPTFLIRGLKFLTAPDDSQYLEAKPASALIFTDGMNVDYTIQPIMQGIAPAGISTIPVMVSFGQRPFRFASAPANADLFVNSGGDDEFLTANGADLQVTGQVVADDGSPTLGGLAPAAFSVGGSMLLVGGGILAVSGPDIMTPIGHDNLTGVFDGNVAPYVTEIAATFDSSSITSDSTSYTYDSEA
jgi:hypothetical protein